MEELESYEVKNELFEEVLRLMKAAVVQSVTAEVDLSQRYPSKLRFVYICEDACKMLYYSLTISHSVLL